MTKDAPAVMSWDNAPRRLVTIYLPLAVFVIVLLFPFYWMTITTLKPNNELYDYKTFNPLWVSSPTLQNIRKLLFETDYPHWLMTTMGVAAAATIISVFSSVLRPTPSSGCAFAARTGWGWQSTSLTWCRRRSCSSRSRPWCSSLGCSTARGR